MVRPREGRFHERAHRSSAPGIDHTGPDPAIPRSGRIILQIHGGGPAEVWSKDIRVESPPADGR